MIDKNFDPWKRVREFRPEALLQESSDLVQWPIKLYKAPKLSPYYHGGHLLIAADCSAFSYPGFHDALSKGRIPLICCPENDFDITVKLADIFSLNDIASVTIVTMDKPCCAELKDMVLRAVKASRLPIPVQITNLFVDAVQSGDTQTLDDFKKAIDRYIR